MPQPVNGLALLQEYQANEQAMAMAPLRQQALVSEIQARNQGMANDQQTLQMNMEAKRRSLDREQQTRGILANLQAGGDPEKMGQALMGTNPELGIKLIGLSRQQKQQGALERHQQAVEAFNQSRQGALELHQQAQENYNQARLVQMDNALTAKAAPPQPIVHTDAEGNLFERDRMTGKWTRAMGPEGPITSKIAGALNPAKLAEQDSLINSVTKQIDDLKSTITGNSGTLTGVVGPKGVVNRVYETVKGVVPGQQNEATPALTAQSKKELIVANVRKLISGGGVFSNQDAKRLDDALSMGLMSTEGSAIQGLDDLKSFLQSKRPNVKAQATNKPKAEDFFR